MRYVDLLEGSHNGNYPPEKRPRPKPSDSEKDMSSIITTGLHAKWGLGSSRALEFRLRAQDTYGLGFRA